MGGHGGGQDGEMKAEGEGTGAGTRSLAPRSSRFQGASLCCGAPTQAHLVFRELACVAAPTQVLLQAEDGCWHSLILTPPHSSCLQSARGLQVGHEPIL